MSRTVVTLNSFDLNDGTKWRLRPGFDSGEDDLTFDVYYSYTGDVALHNVRHGCDVAEVSIPVTVTCESSNELITEIASLNSTIANCTFDSPGTLTVGSATYSIVDSQPVRLLLGILESLGISHLTITLNRLP